MELKIDDLTLYYEVNGITNGNMPVVFLHGWGGGVASFQAICSVMSKSRKTINTDFAGFGKSDIPKNALGIEDYAEHILRIMEKEKIEKADFVVHSFGGRVALYIASNHPERVNRLVLADTAGIKPRFNLIKAIKIKRYKSAKKKGRDLSRFGSKDYSLLEGAMKETFVRIVNYDLTPSLKKINAPTLIVWGGKDKDTPLYMAKKLKKHISKSTLKVFKDSGHFCYIEHHTKFLILVEEFLS